MNNKNKFDFTGLTVNKVLPKCIQLEANFRFVKPKPKHFDLPKNAKK